MNNTALLYLMVKEAIRRKLAGTGNQMMDENRDLLFPRIKPMARADKDALATSAVSPSQFTEAQNAAATKHGPTTVGGTSATTSFGPAMFDRATGKPRNPW